MKATFIPVPIPDETGLGVMLRAARRSNIKHYSEFVRTVAPALSIPAKGSNQAQFNLLLRWFCFAGGYPVEEVISKFTNLHAYVPFANSRPEIWLDHGPWIDSGSSASVSNRFAALGTKFGCAKECAACNRENLEIYGTTTWMRAHQLPGVALCWKHGCDLFVRKFRKTGLDLPDFEEMPSLRDKRGTDEHTYAICIKEISESGLPWLHPDDRAAFYRHRLSQIERGEVECHVTSRLMRLLAEDNAGTLLLPGFRLVSNFPERNLRLIRMLFPNLAEFSAAFRLAAAAKGMSSTEPVPGIKLVDELKHREENFGFSATSKCLFRIG